MINMANIVKIGIKPLRTNKPILTEAKIKDFKSDWFVLMLCLSLSGKDNCLSSVEDLNYSSYPHCTVYMRSLDEITLNKWVAHNIVLQDIWSLQNLIRGGSFKLKNLHLNSLWKFWQTPKLLKILFRSRCAGVKVIFMNV